MTSITKELRELAADPLLGYTSQKVHAEVITAIADRIDAELAERYVELPLDADGVPIHEGDKLRDHTKRKSEGIVERLMTDSGEWWVGFHGEPGWSTAATHEWHRCPSDSWERIINEAVAVGMDGGLADTSVLIDRCKALAGEDS